MKFEIINPSDKCFIDTDNVTLAKVVGNLLGKGLYVVRNTKTGKIVLSIFETPFGDPEKYQKFVNENRIALAEVFESFYYADERTSLNDIGEKAKRFAKALREREQEETP